MKKIILLCFLLLATFPLVFAQVSQYYKLDLLYNLGNISIQSVSVVPFSSLPNQVEGSFIVEVVSSKNEILNLTFFSIPTFKIVTYRDPKTNELYDKTVYLNQSFATVYVPYFENAAELNIYDWNLTRKLTLDVSSFSRTKDTSLFILSQSKNKSSDLLQNQIPKTESSSQKSILILISLAIILILFLIYFILFRKRKETKEP